MKKLFLLDAMALIYRAYYAMIKSPRMTSKGLNTSAVLGFTNTLYDIIKNEKPSHIAVSFDTGAPTLRHADFAAYKANREATPEDIITSIPYIKKVIEAFSIPIVSLDGYEADDVIGTIAKNAEIEGFKVYMMTSDKDYGQLVSDNIFMYKPSKFGSPSKVVGVEEICETYGINRPEQLIDILGLWGDASDNIPGVPGIGEVKAKKLIAQFDSVENIYRHIDEVDNAKLKQTLVDNQEQALMSKMLATIILDVPVSIDFDAMEYKGPNRDALKAIFTELEFNSLMQRVFTDLSLKNQSSNESSLDLFSPITIPVPVETKPSFDSFEKHEHHFKQLLSVEDFPAISDDETLFFEWIISNNKIAGFAFALNTPTVYYHFLENEQCFYKIFLSRLFEQPHNMVIFQSKITYRFLKALKINPHCNFFDIQIAHYLIQPEMSHQIERLTESYLNYTIIKDKTDSLESVACESVELYQRLFPLLNDELQNDDLYFLFDKIEMPLAQVLADMEYVGVKVDVNVLRQNADVLNDDIIRLENQIFDFAGERFNLASPKQLGELLFNKLQIIENAKLTKTKQYQTGEEILNKLVNKHPIVPLILQWRSLTKLKSTYVDALPLLIDKKTGRIHTTFNQTVTSTGRLSSINPNLQNIPIRTERGRDIRKAFVAPYKDWVIMSADYSQIELRIVASVCKDEKMIEAFKNHVDIHTAMAANIYKVDNLNVTPEMRRNAKTVNFGILYGISAFGLAERLHIPQKEARELITSYFENFPAISNYLNDTIARAQQQGYVETLLNRRRYIKDINSRNAILRKAAERNAINAPIQGTAADLIKIAMLRIWRELQEINLKTKMILQVHDELIFEVPQEEIAIVKPMIQNTMCNAMELAVPLDIEINYGQSWYDAH